MGENIMTTSNIPDSKKGLERETPFNWPPGTGKFILAFMVVFAALAYPIAKLSVPEWLIGAVGMVFGYYFRDAINALKKKNNEKAPDTPAPPAA